MIDLKEINLASDVFLFSFNPSEFDQAIVLAEELKRRPIIHPKLMINGSTFGLEGTEKLKKILVSDHWAYLPDTIQETEGIVEQNEVDIREYVYLVELEKLMKEEVKEFSKVKKNTENEELKQLAEHAITELNSKLNQINSELN